MRQFLLMSSVGCHLCDEAIEILIQHMNPELHQVDEIDIAFDDQLMEKYATSIPVLVDEQTGEELKWPFDLQALQGFISSLK